MSGRERWIRVSAILDRALEIEAHARGPLLDELCAGDAALRAEVDELLAAAEVDGALSRPVLDVGAALLTAAAGEGARSDLAPRAAGGAIVGSYRLLSELGRGGMGEVWLAERSDADFEQRVAVKLLRGGFGADAGRLEERFRRERRILAGLEHPHIARLLDGGVTPDGRPFLVMEAVDGEPITAHCRRLAAPIEERLRLFLQVCEAVAAAHRRLVVHRDLKPSNILVSESGGVKLLDFGVAKLLDDSEGEGLAAGLTARDERWMTPAYAAPEQVSGAPVTTATDVFALGVVLYELLAGAHPFETSNRRALERAIVETQPENPSARSAEASGRRLRGDLDAIVLMALRKEPERRYASVEALAADVRRFLDGRPVAARPDAWGYRAGKFARRHRWALAGAAAALVALVAGLTLALAAREREALAARRATAVRDFLVGLFEQASPEVNGGDEPALRQIVADGAAEVEAELAGAPEVAADLLGTLAQLNFDLGEYATGLDLARRAQRAAEGALGGDSPAAIEAGARVAEGLHLTEAETEALAEIDRVAGLAAERSGVDSPELAAVLERKTAILRKLGRFDDAEAENARLTAIYARRPGTGSIEWVRARAELADILFNRRNGDDSRRAVEIAREVLERKRALFPAGHPSIGRALNDLGAYLANVSLYDEAERYYGEAIAVHTAATGADSPSAIESRRERTAVLSELGRYDEALAELEEVVAASSRRWGPTSWNTFNAINKIGFTLYQRGRAGEAVPRFAEAWAIAREKLGPDHPDTLSARSNYGGALAESGDLEAGERELVEVVAARRKSGTNLIASLNLLGRTLRRKGDAAGALALHREALALSRDQVGADTVDSALADYLCGLALHELGRFDEAAAELEAALAIDRAQRAAGHSRIGEDLTALARARVGQRRAAEAEPLAREAVAIQAEALGPENGKTADARLVLGEVLVALGRLEEGRREAAAAAPLLERAGAGFRAQLERARRIGA